MTGPLPLSNDEVALVLRIMDNDLMCRAHCAITFDEGIADEDHALHRNLYEKLQRHFGRYSVKWNMVWFDENHKFTTKEEESE